MKQQFVVTNRYTVLDETEKTCHILNKATVKSVRFLRKYAKLFFFFFVYIHDFDRRVCNPAVY